ncbi:hypothetical protein EDD16DRAFT_13316 [Pisolithus croceorrhizus]|nr:hypothetical protein EDD16DRAFT_13316 [Pisolithus croceorrhizus]
MDIPTAQQTDLVVKSIPDQIEFNVRRCDLEKSEIFRDMFAVCNQGSASADGVKTLADSCYVELDEPAQALKTLLELLRQPPPPPLLYMPDRMSAQECWMKLPFSQRYEHDSVIPFPLLPGMIRLSDKYGLSDPLVRSLRSHLVANAFLHPLKVYGFARANGFEDVAVEASTYLLHPPLASYSREDISVIPTVAAYHDLVQLHAHRIKKLQEILLSEEIFPFGYGLCALHCNETARIWNERRVQLVPKVEAASDIAAEMRTLMDQLSSCQVCRKACLAATEMLEYKCRRITRTIGYLPSNGRET